MPSAETRCYAAAETTCERTAADVGFSERICEHFTGIRPLLNGNGL